MQVPPGITREHGSLERIAGKEILQRGGSVGVDRGWSQGNAAQESDAAAGVSERTTAHVIPVDLAAELQSMFSRSVGNVVDNLDDIVGPLKLRPFEPAQPGEISAKADPRQPSGERTAHPGVKTVIRRWRIEIARQRGLVKPVVSHPDFIDPTRRGRVNPASSNDLGARVNIGQPFGLEFRKIFDSSRVIAKK